MTLSRPNRGRGVLYETDMATRALHRALFAATIMAAAARAADQTRNPRCRRRHALRTRQRGPSALGRGGRDAEDHSMTRQALRTHQEHRAPARRHHWLRWAGVGLAAVLVLGVAGTFGYVHLQTGPVPAPLALPKLTAAAAGGGGVAVGGTWTAGNGSLAGYRVREDFLGAGHTMVGRTSVVTGRFVIARNEVTAAFLRVELTAVTAQGTAQPQFAKILDTASFPAATFTLTKPIVVGSRLVMNKTVRVRATGLLTMHGTTRPVTFQATARYSGSLLEAAGSIPVQFTDWNIRTPQFLQGHGVLEFLLILRH
jgi:polyisoprenoid-binding protein YceI